MKKKFLKYGTLLVCLFFSYQNFFLGIGKVTWQADKLVMIQIGDMANKLGNQFNEVMTDYFETFHLRMHARKSIPSTIVDLYKDEVCFLVSIDHCIIQAVELRTEYALELGYEISSKVAKSYADALQESDLDLSAYRSGIYEEILKILKKKSSVNLKRCIQKGLPHRGRRKQ